MTPHPGKTHRRPVLHASWPRRIVGTLICLASLAAVVYMMRPVEPTWPRAATLWAASLACFGAMALVSRTHTATRFGMPQLKLVLVIIVASGLSAFITVEFVGRIPVGAQAVAAIIASGLIFNMLYLVVARVRLTIYRRLTQETPQRPDADWPRLDALLAVRNEPLDVVLMTVKSVLALDYPPQKLHMVVVDNSDRGTALDELTSALDELGATTQARLEFIHRDGTDGFKPRNLDIGLEHLDADLILVVDADSTLTPDTAKAAVTRLEADKTLAAAQMPTISTNGSAGFVARGSALFITMLRISVSFLNEAGGFLFYYGHNGMWRRSALDEVAPWEQYYRGQIMVGEDEMLSVLAYADGYEGATVHTLAGDWVPMTIDEFRTTYTRWSYAFCQSLARDGYRLAVSPRATALAKVDELQRMLFILASALLPLLPVTAFFSRSDSALESLYIVTFLLLQLAGTAAIWRHFRPPTGRWTAAGHALGGGFLMSAYSTWIAGATALGFLVGRKQGWKPTQKAAGVEPGIWRVLRMHWVMTAYCIIVIAASAVSFIIIETSVPWPGAMLDFIDMSLGAGYAISLLLFLIVYGTRREAPQVDTTTMNIGHVQSPFD